MNIASFFAGVGGIDLGFKQAGFNTIYANEFDKFAVETFELNFPNVKVDTRDIRNVLANEVPNHDVLVGGFPCQPFSILGDKEGFNDKKGRGTLFFELTRIMKEKRPRVAFFENVKNLVTHDNGNTLKVICSELDKIGYKYKYQVMNACDFGDIPQNRERIYIVAFRDEKDYNKFDFPSHVPLIKTIHDVIDFGATVDEKYYYSNEKHTFFHKLETDIISQDTMYQWRRSYVRENKSNLIPTLTASMGTGGNNVPLILTNDKRIRKITPYECFKAQGFPSDYKLPSQGQSHLYKQAGNSVCVPVIWRIAEKVIEIF